MAILFFIISEGVIYPDLIVDLVQTKYHKSDNDTSIHLRIWW